MDESWRIDKLPSLSNVKTRDRVVKVQRSGIKLIYEFNYLDTIYEFSNETLHSYSLIYGLSNGTFYSKRNRILLNLMNRKKFFTINFAILNSK